MTETEDKKPVGRPSDYKPEYQFEVEKLCKLGATDKELADFFGVCEATINTWKIVHPEFLESLKRGKMLADANVADRLYQRAMGYEHEAVKIWADPKTQDEKIVKYTEHYPPDTTAGIFWLKNRQPDKWRDKSTQELTGLNGEPLAPTIILTGSPTASPPRETVGSVPNKGD